MQLKNTKEWKKLDEKNIEEVNDPLIREFNKNQINPILSTIYQKFLRWMKITQMVKGVIKLLFF